MKIKIPKYVPKTQEEADFIEAFDPTVYALSNPAVAVDMVLFSYDKKLKKLKTIISGYGQMLVALSGGVDIAEIGRTRAASSRRENLWTRLFRESLKKKRA